MRFGKIEDFDHLTTDPGDTERLYKFAKDFNIVGYGSSGWGANIDYFNRLLIHGTHARRHIADRGRETEHYHDLFDHRRFFKTADGKIILVSNVYSNIEFVEKCFAELKEKYNLDDRIKMKVMDQKYNFYWRDTTKTTMLLFYAEDDLK